MFSNLDNPELPLLPRWMANRWIGRWINLLDTGPLKKTLVSKFHFDEEKLANSQTNLLISATKVKTGESMLFSNTEVTDHKLGGLRADVSKGITADRILASCSIPLVYPWTKDEATQSLYWDGALVANTPLGAALDLVGKDKNTPAEIVIVSDDTLVEIRRARSRLCARRAQILRRGDDLDAGLDAAFVVP